MALRSDIRGGVDIASPRRPGRVVIVDRDRRLASALAEWLCTQGHHASAAGTAEEAIRLLERGPCSACVVDAGLPDDGVDRVADGLRAAAPQAAVVLAVASERCDTRRLPVADAVVPRPLRDAAILEALAAAHEAARRRRAGGPSPILGGHPAMRRVLELAARIATTPATVRITGESGTGKSLLARHIHALSGRQGRFVEVACGSLSEPLLESELFGHVPGAFTGATTRRSGRFELADRGTIFLDEIATAPPALQVKLLRVLQELQFEPVGGAETITVDSRVIVATNEDLSALVAAGRFRADLFWRIDVVSIEMPALRDRADDIPNLAATFLARAADRSGRDVAGFTPRALEALCRHRWPGNVRELEHAVERAVLLGRGDLVDLADLPPAVVAARAADGRPPATPTLKRALATPERQLILDALERSGWRRDVAARALGINRTTLYKKLKRLGLDLAAVAPY
jgi:DNA-binding NtrC family response regulator